MAGVKEARADCRLADRDRNAVATPELPVAGLEVEVGRNTEVPYLRANEPQREPLPKTEEPNREQGSAFL